MVPLPQDVNQLDEQMTTRQNATLNTADTGQRVARDQPRCTCVCDCEAETGQDGVLWLCSSHCEALVCGACIAVTNPVVCHWCMNPLYFNPREPHSALVSRNSGCIPSRSYTDHGFVGIRNPPLARISWPGVCGWIVPLARGRHQTNPMYNENGVKIMLNFKRCFFAPSMVRIPIEHTGD